MSDSQNGQSSPADPTQPVSLLALSAPSPCAIRAELLDLVTRDLLGPAGGPDEEIHERNVRDRYVVGMLAPKHRLAEPEEDEDLAEGGAGTPEDGPTDVGTLQSTTLLPSAFGLTFCLDGGETALRVTARWGRYERTHSERTQDRKGEPALVWKRRPVEETFLIPLEHGRIQPHVPSQEFPEVLVRGLARKREGDTEWTVSLFLVNGQGEPKKLRDSAWLFQPELIIEGVHGGPVFTRRGTYRAQGKLDTDVFAELKGLEMLYRRRPTFATGHNVSVHTETAEGNPNRAVRVATRVVPMQEIARTTPPTDAELPLLSNLVLDMQSLAEMPDGGFAQALDPLTEAYQDWITSQNQRITGGADGLDVFQETAQSALARCEEARTRIQVGIDLLGTNPQAAEAFRFLNRAMWKQRTHTLYSEKVRRGEQAKMSDVDTPANRRWYPFLSQLASSC